ncbi:hypothetical protein [Streptomyces sp. NPDC007100]|uniref:terpene synthase family protein n=1 Tax=Streptomyces sp. NPDC007100 TaxID=3155602 RepID=UPI0033CB13AC
MDDHTDAGPGPKPPEFYLPGPARLNPHVEEARSHCRAWAVDMGMLRAGPLGARTAERQAQEEGVTVWDEKVFDAADYGLLAALAHPDASAPRLCLLADWYVWRYFFADRFAADFFYSRNVAGAAEYAARLRNVMGSAGHHDGGEADPAAGPVPSEAPAPPEAAPAGIDPVERGLTDLWARTVAGHEDGWRTRFAKSINGMVDSARGDLADLDAGRVPNPVENVAARRAASGGPWAARLVEHVTAFEIPGRLVGTRPIRVLEDTFADAAGLREDIVTVLGGRRAADRPGNAVNVAGHFLKCAPQQAVDIVAGHLASRMRQFDRTEAAELPPLFGQYGLLLGERTSVLRHTDALRDWQAGFHEWLTRPPESPRGTAPRHPRRSWTPCGTNGFGCSGTRVASTGTAADAPGRAGRRPPGGHTLQLPVFHVPFRSVAPNPFMGEVRTHVRRWAREMGMVREGSGVGPDWSSRHATFDEASFEASDFPTVSALSFPTAPRPRLEVAVDCSVWGTHVGDYITKKLLRGGGPAGAKAFVERLKTFLPDRLAAMPVPLNPAERGLADLWQRLLPELSQDSRRHWRTDFTGFLEGRLWQAANSIEDRVPDPVDYLEMRRASLGGLLSANKVEYCLEKSLSGEIWDSGPITQLREITADILTVNNDAASYPMELAEDGAVNNLVTVIQELLGTDDPVAAAHVANDLADRRTGQFRSVAGPALRELFDEHRMDEAARNEITEFVTGLEQLLAGLQQWVDDTGRYAGPSVSKRTHPKVRSGHSAGYAAPR